MALRVKRTIIIFIFLLVQIFFLYLFYRNEEAVRNFRFVYVPKVYVPAMFEELKLRINSGFASIGQVFKDSTVQASQEYAESVPILLYHGIVNKYDGNNVTIDNFRKQMFALKENGYTTVGIEDFYLFMKGEKRLPEKSIVITFDDGRSDSYYPVDPILEVLDYSAVMFIITSRLEHPFHISEEMLKKMQASGRWELQPHGRDDHDLYPVDITGEEGHFLSNRLWLETEGRLETAEEFRERIRQEFINANEDMQNIFGVDSISFSFPFGDYGQNTVNFPGVESVIVEEAKKVYGLVFFQVWPGVGFSFNHPEKDFFMTRRIYVRPEWDEHDLILNLEQGAAKEIPFVDDFSTETGWVTTWGDLALRKNEMIVGASNVTTGSLAFLNGSNLWRDYIFKARVDWQVGINIALAARYQDDSNFVSCSFTKDVVNIEQALDGERHFIRGVNFNPPSQFEAAISVSGRNVRCFINGALIVESQFLDPSLVEGGIGFKTWDGEFGTSRLVVKEVRVEPSN